VAAVCLSVWSAAVAGECGIDIVILVGEEAVL
jgi:hypothetical protein